MTSKWIPISISLVSLVLAITLVSNRARANACDTPALCDGDVNGDGAVDPLDAGAILARFGLDPTDPEICQYDVNCDGGINPLDTGYVLARFGTCAPPEVCQLGDSSDVLINEFLPDPFGLDEDPIGPRNGGHEAVEFINVGSASADVSGWELQNAAGDVLFTFPKSTVIPPPDSRGDPYLVLLVLGSTIDTLASDFGGFGTGMTPNTAILFEGTDRGNRIGNDSDALILRDDAGQIVDAVLFGVSEPTGPGVTEARDAGHWAGDRVNTSFADGGVPLGDGEGVLGRDRHSSDSNGAADWRIHGGADAFGGSFGHTNLPNRFPMAAELVHSVQGFINEFAAMISINNSPAEAAYLGFTGASFDSLVVTPRGDDYTLSAAHTFDYTSTDFSGTTTTGQLTGMLIVDYSVNPGVTDTLTATGTLVDTATGRSLTLSLSGTFDGYGTVSVTTTFDVNFTWTDPTGSYSYSNAVTRSDAWTGQSERTITDHREYVDWSSAATKVSDATYVTQYVADGETSTAVTVTRTEPFYHSAFGIRFDPIPGHTSELQTQYATSIDSDGQVVRTFSQYDMFLQGPTTKVLYVELDPAATPPASLTLSRTDGKVGDFLGTFEETMTLPIIVYDLGQFPESKVYTMTRSITKEYVPGASGDPVFVVRFPVDIQLNGSPHSHFDYYIDGWMKWVAKAVQVTAVGLCAAGATATAPSVIGAFGFAAGSAAVVVVWMEVEKEYEDDE